MGTRTCPGGARARYGGPCRRHSSRRRAGGQTSRTLRATAIPIATRISKTSSFFTADLLVDGRSPDASETDRPTPEVNGVWWPPSSSKRVGRAIPVRWVRFLPPPPIRREKETGPWVRRSARSFRSQSAWRSARCPHRCDPRPVLGQSPGQRTGLHRGWILGVGL